MTELLRIDDQLETVMREAWYIEESWYASRRQADTRDDPTSLLRRQLHQAIGLLDKLESGQQLSFKDELNPICELTLRLGDSDRDLSVIDEVLRDNVSSAILNHMHNHAEPKNREPYQLLFRAMGGELEEAQHETPVTEKTPKEIRVAQDAVSLTHYRETHAVPEARRSTVNWGSKNVRVAATAAVAATLTSLLPQTSAAARPTKTPAAAENTGTQKKVRIAQTERVTQLIVNVANAELLPTATETTPKVQQLPLAHPGTHSQAELLPNAPEVSQKDQQQSVVPVASRETVNIPAPPVIIPPESSRTVPIVPSGSSLDLTEPVVNISELANPGGVSIDPAPIIQPGVGQTIAVNNAATLANFRNPSSPAEQNPPAEPTTVSIDSSGTLASPVITMPAPETPQVEAANQFAALDFVTENGTTADAVQEQVQMIAERRGLAPLSDTPFQKAVSQIVSGDATVNSTAEAQNRLVTGGIIARLPSMYAELGDAASVADLSPFESTLYSQYSDPATGMASLEGADQLTPEEQQAVFISLAKYQADTMTIPQKREWLRQFSGADITVIAPELSNPNHETGHHQPAPHHINHRPTHHQNNTPHGPHGTHHEQHPSHDTHGSLVHLSERQLAMQVAEKMAQGEGVRARQGEMMLFFLQNTHWTPHFILGGPIANGMHESEGLNPMRAQATQTDVPAARVLALHLSGGWGYWQSDPPTKVIEWCYEHGLDPNTIEGQGAWLISSVRSNSVLNAVAHDENTSVRAATIAFEQQFERAGVPAMVSRLRYAVDAATHFLPNLLGLLQTQQQQREAAREARIEARQEAKAARKEGRQQAKIAHTPYSEYVLGVPKDGEGHAVPYINQVTDLDGVDGINGYDACGLTSLYTIEQALKKNPQTAATLHQGLMNANAYSDSAGVLNTDNLINYIRQNLNLQVSTILYERSETTDDNVMAQVRQALDQGKILLVHTSLLVSGREGGSTSGHFLVMYGYNDSGYYVANVGARADSPPQGYAFSRDTIEQWLDGFYAISN